MAARRTAPVLLAGALLLAACSSASEPALGGSKEPTTAGRAKTTAPVVGEGTLAPFTGGDFYAAPDPLPSGEHGTLIRYEPARELTTDDAAGYRILYVSQSVAGKAIVVSGTAIVPTAKAPTEGRNVLTLAHGTTGVADACAPSKNPAESEGRLAIAAAGSGYLVAETDYEGLGTPGRHPYLVGESEGRSVLDAALAAGQLPRAKAGRRLGIAGYSQGGHGALWANQLAATWTPDLDVVGTFAGAPASEVGIILAVSGGPAGGFGLLLVAGLADAYPKLKLDDVLTPAGQQAVTDLVDQKCISQIIPGLAQIVGPLVQPGALDAPAWQRAAKAQDAGTVETPAPILVIQSKVDDVVPIAFSQILTSRLCGLKQTLEYRVLPEGGHIGAAVPAYQQGIEWLTERFAPGAPAAVSTCP